VPSEEAQLKTTQRGGGLVGPEPPEKVETMTMISLRAKLFALAATAAAALWLGVIPSMASAETAETAPPIAGQATPSEAEASVTIPLGASAGNLSPQALSECPSGGVCAWAEGEYRGKFSWWLGSQTGCHGHADNTPLYSFWNRTQNYTVRLGGQGSIQPGEHFTVPFGVYGELCWS
jgi:hypothetical protein